MREVELRLNGETVARPVEARTHLADFLREEHLLTGTHLGCEQGVCGACTLFLDGRPVRACITLAAACDGAEVHTVEGFGDDPLMARLREAFKQHHGLQCGYCTPGMLATAYDIVRRLPNADAARIRRELSGNLCRCTGYAGIVAAIEDVLSHDPPAAQVVPLPRRRHSRPAAPERPAAAAPAAVRSSAVSGDLPAFESYAGPQELADGIALKRSVLVEAPLAAVWEVVREPPSVVACIPGASLAGPPQGEALAGACAVSLGPMSAAFRGTAAMRLKAAERRGRVVGVGRDGLSRSTLEGALDFALEPEGDATRLELSLLYRLKGPLAQFGRPALVEEVADRILAQAAAALAARATGQASAPADPQPLNGVSLAWSVLRGLLRRVFWRG